MKPIIGIIAGYDNDKIHKVSNQYVSAIENAGGLPFVIPSASEKTLKEIIEVCDGFLFTGGVDIDPKYYGEEILAECGDIHPYRDEFELLIFKLIYETKKPIMGICRGHQLVCVALGGSLYQDIPAQCPSNISHRQTEAKNDFSHSVTIEENTPLYHLVGKTRMKANSFHHQAVKCLGKGQRAMATSDDGTVEACFFEGERYIATYQWHPERIRETDSDNANLFIDFIKHCTK